MPNIPAGSGSHIVVTSAVPAAGAEIALAIPPRCRWDLHSIYFQLVCDANVANREVVIRIDRQSFGAWWVPSQLLVVANSVTDYYFMAGWGLQPYSAPPAALVRRCISLPSLITLESTDSIHTVTNLRQVGDQFSYMAVSLIEHIDP